MSYQCLICFENIKKPAILNLNCECQYNVHYKCYNKWWKMKKNCMICHTPSEKPRSFYHFKDKTNYYFLLDLHNKSRSQKHKLKLSDLVPNIKYHAVFFGLLILINFIYLKLNIMFFVVFFFFYFIFVLP